METFRTNLAELTPEERLRWRRYRIRAGDTLASIAARHGASVADLQRTNQLKGTHIRAGSYLLVPISTAALDRHALSPELSPASDIHYTVKPGDSLWTIARHHRVSHHKLASWNGLSTQDVLQPGQRLLIQQPSMPDARPQKVAANAITSRSSVSYRVRKGDSLYTIARRFDVSVADLQRWNRLAGRYLQPGQKLLLYLDVSELQAL